MKYATITGWKGEAGTKFHGEMAKRIKGYEGWNKAAIEGEVFSRCEEQLTGDEAMDYELSRFDTVSGRTELLSFYEEDFEVEWREED